MNTKSKAAGKMAALTEGVASTKQHEARNKTHYTTTSPKYDTQGALNKLHQAL